MVRKVARYAPALTLCLTLAACGSPGGTTSQVTSSTPSSTEPASSPSTSPPTTSSTGNPVSLDPCGLLTAADQTALKATAGAPSSNDFGPACDFGVPGGNLTITAIRPEVSDATFESATNKTPIAGIGDEAFFDPDWHRVRAKKNANRVQVSCLCALSGQEELTFLKAVTARVVSHLP